MMLGLLLLAGVVAMDAQHRRGVGATIMVDKSKGVDRTLGIREDPHVETEAASMLEKKESLPQTYPWASDDKGPTWLTKETGGPVILSNENFCRYLSDDTLNQPDSCGVLDAEADCGSPASPKAYLEGTADSNGEYTLCEWMASGTCTDQRGRHYTFASTEAQCYTRLEDGVEDGPNDANYTEDRCRTECGGTTGCKYWNYFRGVCEHWACGTPPTVSYDTLGYSSGQCAHGGDKCLAGSTHKCPWTVHMKELKTNNDLQQHSCHSRLLEARRTLDGLLHAVNTTYHEMMVDNDKIKVANVTLEEALEDHRAAEEKLVSDRAKCDADAIAKNVSLVVLERDILELQSISAPLRSDVSLNLDYVKETIDRATNEDSQVNSQYTNLADPDVENFTMAIVDNVAKGGNSSVQDVTNGTRTSDGWSGFVELSETQGSGVLDQLGVLDSDTCNQMTSLLEKSAVRHKRSGSTGSCVDTRVALKTRFEQAWTDLTNLYDRVNFEIGYNRTYCLKNASYNYNYTILGPGGVDERITDAAETIHVSQQTIMVLLPRLHDLEHAVTQMRSHITDLNSTCRVDARVTVHLQTIQQLIHDMQECPGRNNFTLTIPKWQTNRVATPPPTPYGKAPGPITSGDHVQQATLYDYEFGAARRRGNATAPPGPKNEFQDQYQGRTYTYSEDGTKKNAGKGVTTVS